MKGILEFDLPTEQEEFQTAIMAPEMKSALWDIAQEVFRPARKHGYNGVIQTLLDKADTVSAPSMDGYSEDDVAVGTELVSQLERLFYEILNRHGVEI